MQENNTPEEGSNKKDPRKEFFATIGYSYIMEMKRNREFRRKMEKTEFGKATKRYLIQVLKEDEYGLYYESKVGKHNLGQDYIKMIESGLIAEHSIGFKTLREQKSGEANQIHEVMLFEGSSLTAWGANEATPLLGMKNMNNIEQIQDQIKSFEK